MKKEAKERRLPWKVQMGVIWLSQALSLMGFSFSLAFAPYFLQEDLGIGAGEGLEMWVGLFTSSTAVTMALAAPVWGWLADRYGKRIMLLRANFGGAACMSLMGLVTAPGVLIALRSLQGMLTGTMTAAQAYLSASVPAEKRGLAMGGLSAAVYSGTMGGAFFGGLVAKAVGYRWAFGVSGVVLLLSGLLVLAGTEERRGGGGDAAGAAGGGEGAGGGRKERWRVPGAVWGALGLVFAVSLARQFDLSFLPLLVQEIHGRLDADVALWNGLVNACGSVAGLLAGVMTGWLADRMRPYGLVAAGAVAAAVFSGSQMWVGTFGELFPVRFCTIFAAGMLEPALNAWMARNVEERRQGVVFGLASTARSVGWSVGPMLAGVVATWKLRAVYGVSCGAYLALGVVCAWMWRREGGEGRRGGVGRGR